MNKAAKALVNELKRRPQAPNIPTFPNQKITLFLADIPIVGDLRYQLQQHMYGHRLEARLRKTLPHPNTSLHPIDWYSMEIAFNQLTPLDKISRMKTIHQLIPTKDLLCARNQETSSTCLRCKLAAETYDHVFRCKCEQNKRTHRESLVTLQTQLRKINTNPLIIHAVTALVSANHNNSTAQYPSPLLNKRQHNRILNIVFQQQLLLGSNALIRGLIARNWMILQNLHINAPINYISTLWAQVFIQSLWNYTHTI